MRCIWILVLIFSTCHGKKVEPLNRVYHNRSKQYSKNPYKKIIQVSSPRTGSTVVYNILRYLFEDKRNLNKEGFNNFNMNVIKSHELKEEILNKDYTYVVTIRDPVDTIYSNCKIYFKKEVPQHKIDHCVYYYFYFLQQVEKYKSEGYKFILLRYEDFCDKFDSIFDRLEKHFSIKIDQKDKEYIDKAFSKQNVLDFIKKYPNFLQYDKSTMLHGDHIIDKSKLDIELINRIKEALVPHEDKVKDLGYFFKPSKYKRAS